MSVYDDTYRNRLAQINKMIEEGEQSAIRLLNRLESASLGDAEIAASRSLKEMDHSRRVMGYALDGQIVQSQELDMSQGLVLHHLLVATLVNKYLSADTVRIVELGSGIGANMFWLWALGGPAQAEYIGYEYAPHGNKCLQAISEIAIGQRIHAYPFDYNAPDFSQLIDNVPTVVFSVHSIEQIKHVSHDLFKAIKSIPGFQRCIHIEPVGYQMTDIEPSEPWLDYQNRSWSTLRNGYNRNLYEVLRDLERDQEIIVRRICKYVGGLHAGNASSLLVWEV